MMNRTLTNGLMAAGLLAALGMGASACKEAQAKTKGVGDNLRAFVVQNCENGDRYCQVCAYGGRPTIMTVADLDDKGVEADLLEIEKILADNKDKGLTAFALFGKFEGETFKPVTDDDAALAKLKEMRTRLDLSFPVTIVPSSYTEKESKSYAPFVAQYAIPSSRTIMVAAADNAVVYADVLTGDAAQYKKLSESVKAKL